MRWKMLALAVVTLAIVTVLTAVAVAPLAIVAVLTAVAIPTPYDDTDDRASGTRSGLALYTDHLTGCQYISLGKRAITPRLDPQGHPVCKH